MAATLATHFELPYTLMVKRLKINELKETLSCWRLKILISSRGVRDVRGTVVPEHSLAHPQKPTPEIHESAKDQVIEGLQQNTEDMLTFLHTER